MSEFIDGFINAMVMMIKVGAIALLDFAPIILTAITHNGCWLFSYLLVIPTVYGLICTWE